MLNPFDKAQSNFIVFEEAEEVREAFKNVIDTVNRFVTLPDADRDLALMITKLEEAHVRALKVISHL